MDIKRYRVLDAPVDAVDMKTALEFVDHAVHERTTPGYIIAINPEKVYVLRDDPFLRRFAEGAALLLPDGIGIVKALHILYGVKSSRVPGADLMQEICAAAPEKGYKIFFYGAKEEVNAGACEILKKRHPGIQIVGRANGYVKPDEMDSLVRKINESGAEILFISMGSPKQEQWVSDHMAQLTTVKLCQGTGGTLDTILGTVKRAPKVWQNLGLEWFYRLLHQPSRLVRQTRCFRFAAKILILKFFGIFLR